MQRVKAVVLLISVILFTAGCGDEAPLAEKQGLPIDASILGLWESVSDAGLKMIVSKYSETEYSIRFPGGKGDRFLRGYPIKVAGISLIQLTGTGENNILKDGSGGYLIISYEFSGGNLVIKTPDSKYTDTGLKSSAALRRAFLKNKDNKDFFFEMLRFRKVSANEGRVSRPTVPKPSDTASRYNAPGIITPLREGRESDIPDDMLVRNYVVSILAGLKDSCPKLADSRPAGVMNVIAYVGYEERKSLQDPNNLVALLALGLLGGETFGDLMAADFIQKHLVREGVDDGAALAKREGCDGGVLFVYNGILRLAAERAVHPPDFPDPLRFRALLSPALQSTMPASQQNPELALPRQVLQKCLARYTGVRWCRCQARALVDARMPDAELKDLIERYDSAPVEKLAERYSAFGKGVNSCVGTDIYRYPPWRRD
jgi:hypothetical protein